MVVGLNGGKPMQLSAAFAPLQDAMKEIFETQVTDSRCMMNAAIKARECAIEMAKQRYDQKLVAGVAELADYLSRGDFHYARIQWNAVRPFLSVFVEAEHPDVSPHKRAGSKRRGRPKDTNAQMDKHIAELWEQHRPKSYADLAALHNLPSGREVKRAIDRHRKRQRESPE
ncbi:MAG: hypothetical protein K8R87_08970 [Verrucomicrobia bacterium]|nr:hypothetical protein [Verrucomicrobiota bacterium]